jgi:hypothetical protein
MTQAIPLKLSDISLDQRAQPRVQLDQGVIEEYAEAIRGGASFPPVIVFFDGEQHHLADGFHRVAAAGRAGRDSVRAEVLKGELRAAILWSVSANVDHGLRRSSADKRRAVQTMLEDEEWRKISDTEIALRCRVSRSLVAAVRSEWEADSSHPAEKQDETITVRRRGKSYSMDLSNMRRKKREREEPEDNLALLSANLALLSADAEATLVESLLELSKGISTFPSAETMVGLLNQYEVDFTSMQAREIAEWFQTLADHLDPESQQNPSQTHYASEPMETC